MDDDAEFLQRLNTARADRSLAAQLLSGLRCQVQHTAEKSVPASLQGAVDASGIVQEAMVRATDRFTDFRGGTQKEMTAWLTAIVKNLVVDHIRFAQTQKNRPATGTLTSMEQSAGGGATLRELLEAEQSSPSVVAGRREQSAVLRRAMRRLAEEDRRVLELRSIRQLSWDETAAAMDRTSGSVRMLWTRALLKLKPALRQEGMQLDD